MPLTDAARSALLASVQRYGRRALRTLALAYKPMPAGTKTVRGDVRQRDTGLPHK